MAKKPTVKGLFKKPTEAQPSQEESGEKQKRRPIGVYLRQHSYDALMQIAENENVSTHGLIAYAVTYFIKQYQAGKVELEPEQTKKRLNLDL